MKWLSRAWAWLAGLVDRLFNRHRLVRRVALFWALAVIGWAIYVTVPKLTGAHAVAALTAIIGILTPVIAFYQWSRNNEKNQ